MNKIFKLVLIFIFLNFSINSFADIISSKYIPNSESIISVVDFNNDNTLILKTSLRNCKDEEKFIINKKINYATVSKYVPSYLIISLNNTIALYSLVSGEITWQWENSFKNNIKIISQDNYGEYISISDGSSVALFRFGKKGLEHIFTKELSIVISSVQPDTQRKVLFVAERIGILSIWSYDGKLLKSTNVSGKISSMILDVSRNGLLIGSDKGIYSMPSDSYEISKISSIKSDFISLEYPAKYLTIVSGINSYIFDYPSMKQIFSLKNNFGKVLTGGSNKFIGFYIKNYIRLFDIKSGLQTATINITNNGGIFLPADMALRGVNASLMDMITGNENNYAENYDHIKICAPVAAMISGITAPVVKNTYSPTISEVNNISNVEKPKKIENNNFIENPKVNNVSKPYVENNTSIPNIKKPEVNSVNQNINQPTNPKVAEVEKPTLAKQMTPSSVPNWIAHRKNLPPFSAVAGSIDEKQAIKSAKKQIKDAVAKEVLKKFIAEKKSSIIDNIDVAKRFLWNAASSAAIHLDNNIIVKDRWVSQIGQSYVLCQLDESLINNAANIAYEKEKEKVSNMTLNEYMSIKPNVID